MDKAEKIWMNGKFVPWDEAKVHVLTHALHYATAVFEGERCYKTVKGPAIFRLREHVQRLFDSAKIYKMKLPFSFERICQASKEIVKVNKLEECYIRTIAFYGYKEMGLHPGKNPIEVAIAAWRWGAYLGEEGVRKGIRCKISSWHRIDTQSLSPLSKATANYANSMLAKMEAVNSGYDEAIMLNNRGYIAEGSGENITMIKNGNLITPPVTSGALRGITLDSVKRIVEDMKLPYVERDIPRDEIYLADEVFLTGTAAEITPVREIDDRIIGSGSPGPITVKIQKKFHDAVTGRDEKYRHWLEPV
jgi:branched-chain amino acid aminotransferase